MTQLILDSYSERYVDALELQHRTIAFHPVTGEYSIYDSAGIVAYTGTATDDGGIWTLDTDDIIDGTTFEWTPSSLTAPGMRISSFLQKTATHFVDEKGSFSLDATSLQYQDGAGNELIATDEGGYYQTVFGRCLKIMDPSQQITGLIFRSVGQILADIPVYSDSSTLLTDNLDPSLRVFELDTGNGAWKIYSPLGNITMSSDTMGVATLADGVWTTPAGERVDPSNMMLTPSSFGVFPFTFRTAASLSIAGEVASDDDGFSLNIKTGEYSWRERTSLAQGYGNETFFIPPCQVHIDSPTQATASENPLPPSPKTYPQERDENIGTHQFGMDDEANTFEYSRLTKVEGAGGVVITTHSDRKGVVTIDGSSIQPNFNDTPLTGQTTAETIAVSGASQLGDTEIEGVFTINKNNFRPDLQVYDGQESVPAEAKFAGNTFFIRVAE